MTNGGPSGTSGGERRVRLVAWLVFAAVGGAFAVVNALSELDERARIGRTVETWEPWCWELTSLAGAAALAPAVFALADRARSWSWPARAAAFVAGSIAFSVLHVAIMVGLREAIYAAVGGDYGGAGSVGDVLLYEYRKDLITFAALLLILIVVRRLLEPRPTVEASEDLRIEVRDGSRTVWLAPGEIEWAQAAGNYVELHGAFGTLLHRRTLAALEGELAPHGFKRIHRARLVRSGAVRSVENRPSGDFEVVMASDARLAGSRRFRERLD